MFKFMKYEIRGTYRYIMGVMALALILLAGIYSFVANENVGGRIFLGLSTLLLFGIALATFLYIVGSFRKELDEDTGYLTFTLPLTGKQIVAAKLVVALLWFFLLGIALALYNLLMLRIFFQSELNINALLQAFTEFMSHRIAVVNILRAVIFGLNLLLLIYFSMALSRVTLRHKKIGGFWFIIFLVLSVLLGYGESKVAAFVPYYLDLDTLKIGTLEAIFNSQLTLVQGAVTIVVHQYLNLAAFLYQIAAAVALYLGTSYLVERKIDL